MTDDAGSIPRVSWPATLWSQTNDPTGRVIFGELAHERGYAWQFRNAWSTEAEIPEAEGAVFTRVEMGETTRVFRREEWVAHVGLQGGRTYVEIAAESEQAGRDALALFRELLPELEPTETDVPVAFWFNTPNGPGQTTRRIQVRTWADVRGNYARSTAEDLDRLMNGFAPDNGGQLMLWQGLPGTGKTHALRALASEWRDWADLHYIVDPDNLFGHQAYYLVQVLLSDSDNEERWKVLVLEDTGELLAADAKAQTGQALSRLLNVVDGLIGQGLRVLVLVTTNEELKTLHPAVARPGRCAAQVTFERIPAEQARGWLADRGGATIDGARTLAELYALAEEHAHRPAQRPVGFALR